MSVGSVASLGAVAVAVAALGAHVNTVVPEPYMVSRHVRVHCSVLNMAW